MSTKYNKHVFVSNFEIFLSVAITCEDFLSLSCQLEKWNVLLSPPSVNVVNIERD